MALQIKVTIERFNEQNLLVNGQATSANPDHIVGEPVLERFVYDAERAMITSRLRFARQAEILMSMRQKSIPVSY